MDERVITKRLFQFAPERSMAEFRSDHSWLPTLWYMASILFAKLLNAPIAATAISDATSAYSIAFAPFSQRSTALRSLTRPSLVNPQRRLPQVVGDFPLPRLPKAFGSWLTRRA